MSEVELPEDAQPGHRAGPWERAYLANKQRRTAEAQQQIDDARAEPTVAERSAYIDAMKEVDVQADAAVKELRDAPTAFRGVPLDAMKEVATGCTCSPEWRSLTWTQNGPTPHMVGCPDAMGGGYSSANDANEVTAWSAINRLAPDTVTLSGARLAAYRQLESAANAAHEAQQAMTTTGVALRDAIQAMCAAMTGVK